MTTTVSPNSLKEGKAKILMAGLAPNTLQVTFKDVATAFNGGKFAEVPGKGQLNADISAQLFQLLEAQDIATCFIAKADTPATLVYNQLTMIPLEVVVRNVAYGSICKRYGLPEKTPFKTPLVEYFLKDDALNDPAITPSMIEVLDLLPGGVSLDEIELTALQINEVLVRFFDAIGICCADFKLEFGLDKDGHLVLGDELSPDNFRLRDKATNQVLDKDVFRLALGDLVETYQTLKQRMENAPAQLFHHGQHVQKPYRAMVFVDSRQNILNPESKAILNSLHTQGFHQVASLRAGKQFILTLKASSLVEAEDQIERIARDILSNPVIEDVDMTLIPLETDE